ncbi:uncharacterized protein LOC129947602 [Eupeodes corollae]|uniref:uncharacterized protein LOC129947602 n=1 Tax=Eupeodes corollae TaxID=290404 RepID=UPI0024922699|nr:uncharacterized protein LOC129947602 [Eupeodes corollae]
MSSNAIVSLSSFNLLFFTQVLTVLTTSIKYNEYVTDKGKNISIPCDANGSIMWIKENGNNSRVIQTGKILVLTNVSENDRGLYICLTSVLNESENSDDDDDNNSKNNEKPFISVVHTNNNVTYVTSTSPLPSPSPSLSPSLSPLPSLSTLPLPSQSPNTSTSILTPTTTSILEHSETTKNLTHIEEEFQAYLKANLSVRTTPGPVSQLYFKASTILGFLIWRFNKSNSGGYPVRSFTSEFRNISYKDNENRNHEHEWTRMDPINIAPNVRQMEVYRLEPNTTYEFRIWANNHLGAGEIVTTNVTTLSETKEEDLIRLIQADLDNFDPRIWIVAVSIVLGTLVILAIGLCIVLSKEYYQSSQMAAYEDGWDSIELIPNIILNPGFCESDDQDAPYTRTIIFGEDDESDGYDSESDDEPRMERFKRKVSIFFTGPTIKRI